MRCQHCDCQSEQQARPVALRDYLWLAEYITRPEVSGKPRWLGVLIVAGYLLSGPVVIAAMFWWTA